MEIGYTHRCSIGLFHIWPACSVFKAPLAAAALGWSVNVVARCSCISGARAPKGRRECKKKTPGKRAAIQPIGRRKLTHPVPCLVYLPRVSCRSSILREAEVVVLPVAGGLHGAPATTF